MLTIFIYTILYQRGIEREFQKTKVLGENLPLKKRLNVYFRVIFANELFKLFQTGMLMDGRLGRTPN